jgi:ferredoxin
VVEVGSEKGGTVIEEFRAFFVDADEEDVRARDQKRQRLSAEVESFIKKRGTPSTKAIAGTVAKNYTSQLWKDFYSTCVECGACNLVCPTCHCFLLFDEKGRGTPVRFMEWDACLYKRFARVAGGANPRKRLWERLRNRFEKKFDFFPKVLNAYACTGCGRCIAACPGDIDIREVLKGLVTGTWNNPPND